VPESAAACPKGIDARRGARSLADERAIRRAHALAHGNDHGVLLGDKFREPLEKVLLVEWNLGKEHQVWRMAARLAGKRGGGGKPAGIAAHDLDEGDALEVVDVGVAGKLVLRWRQ
jgi:hypothetical protein